MDNLILTSPLDMHIHLREGDMLKLVAPLSAKSFAGGVIMPNLMPPIASIERLIEYRQNIYCAMNNEPFKPYMSIFLKEYEYDFWTQVKEHILIAKLYPAGVTTNSDEGASNITMLYDQFEYLQELGIILSIHCETAGDALNREREFLPILTQICEDFPKLKIIFEHISTAEGLSLLNKYENLYATITAHHLAFTIDDLLGEKLKPHLFCKPILQSRQDRETLQDFAFGAHEKVSFGSDSAPHSKIAKESANAPAGIFSAPIALPLLAELFEQADRLENLQAFVSDNARAIYNIEPIDKKITLVKSETTVKEFYGSDALSVVPMFAGQVLSWRQI